MEHAADALFVYNPEGRTFDVNRRACDTLGYTREELLSLSMMDLETVRLPGGVAGLWRGLAPDEPASAEGIHHTPERLKRRARVDAMR
jgi:PAS domain-containing protein